MNRSYPHLSIDQPAVYHILVQGWVSEGWEDWFEGMHLTHTGPPGDNPAGAAETTLLSGVLCDQAALVGTLQRLYSFGFCILNVQFVALWKPEKER